jgi:hypothetical protein
VPTTSWPSSDLETIGSADELQVTSVRADGTLRPYVTIWVVRAGDALCVRSAYGGGGWFHRAKATGIGRVRAGGIERDVTFVALAADAGEHELIDAAYHAKYDRYGATVVGTVVGAAVRDFTYRLDPR